MRKVFLPKGVQSSLDVLQYPDSPWKKTAQERAAMTIACKDADHIPRVANAGKSEQVNGKKVQIMHNGLKVLQNGYQGEWEADVISKLKGIHEPQEEKVFYEVLKKVGDGSVMMELGSWWSYYSMWFLKHVKGSRAYCTEPDPENIKLGRANAGLNGFEEEKDIFFRQYASGKKDNETIEFRTEDSKKIKVPIRTVDSIVAEENIKKLTILHFDIQGAEQDTLKGCEQSIKQGKIRFIFISTHHYSISGNPNIHQECMDFIKRNGGHIIASHTILESCSGDGLIVASFDVADQAMSVDVFRQPTDDSLFRPAEQDTLKLAESFDGVQQSLVNNNVELERLKDQLRVVTTELSLSEKKVEDLERYLSSFKKYLRRSMIIKLRNTDQRIASFLSKSNKFNPKDYKEDGEVLATLHSYDEENYLNYRQSIADTKRLKVYRKLRKVAVKSVKKVHARRVRRKSST